MLKPPTDPLPASSSEERPVGEIVRQLFDEGKDYARAEVGLVKANALGKAKRFKLPAILFGAAFLLAQAAVVVLCVGIFLTVLPLIGTLFAALATTLVTLAVAGGLVWLALRKLKVTQ